MKKALLLLFSLLLISCSAGLATREDYSITRSALEKKDFQKAFQYYPKNEANSFIVSMERAYLNLLQGKPDIDDLIRYSGKVDRRVRFSASRELKTFFYLETPEGYYASEHEIIWLHMLLSWGYSLRGEFEKAYVEARVASNLLSNNWSAEGRFDDPFLRIILASLWTMCGHWEDAQVDFRVAHQLDPSLKWALKLSELSEPPKDYVLVLGGTGPEPKWDPNLSINPIRGIRTLKFESNSKKSALLLKDAQGKVVEMYLTPDSSKWYERHQIRDNEINDLIQDSRYGQLILATTLKEGGRSLLGITAGILVGVGGLGLGGGIIYLGAEAKSEELVAIGFAVAVGGVLKGYEIAADSVNTSITQSKADLDISSQYRFVRFLPDYAWVAHSNKPLTKPLSVEQKGQTILTWDTPIKASIVSIQHYNDTGVKK
jgi:hypothetical protein